MTEEKPEEEPPPDLLSLLWAEIPEDRLRVIAARHQKTDTEEAENS